jgi:hypothetical protein
MQLPTNHYWLGRNYRHEEFNAFFGEVDVGHGFVGFSKSKETSNVGFIYNNDNNNYKRIQCYPSHWTRYTDLKAVAHTAWFKMIVHR